MPEIDSALIDSAVIDSTLSDAVRTGLVPGAVAAVGSSDGVRYLSAFGFASSDDATDMRTDTVCRIASMTKLVTSVAVMQLVEQGLVELDATLADYVPGFRQPEVLVEFDGEAGTWTTRPATRDATLRELLSHTGGYGYWWLHEPLRLASGSEPNLIDPPFLIADPGETFAYSTSSDVIGLLFPPVTGLALDRYFDEHVFGPLEMADTGFRLPPDTGRLARVHRRSGSGFRSYPLETKDHPVRGGGGLYSTAPDYFRFVQCLLRGGEFDGKRILSHDGVAEISRNQIGDVAATMQRTAVASRSNDFIFMDGSQRFGLGVMIETRQHPGKRSVGAYGWGGIVNTFFWVDPARDLAAVLMLQLAPFACRPAVEVLERFETAVNSEFFK